MSQFQTNTLFGAVLIAILWYFFCTSLIQIDTYVGIIGAISSVCIGLWLGWNQKGVGFVGIIGIILTALSFLFSVIPVYNYKPALDTFYASQIPLIVCDSSVKGSITIDSLTVTMDDICKRGSFPLLTQQTIENKTTEPVLINLGMGNSAILAPNNKSTIQRTIEKGVPMFSLQGTTTVSDNGELSSNKTTIKNKFLESKKIYLQKNYPWKRENAPSITKIALRKMRLLSLIDRSYSDKIKNLEVYIQEVN